MESFVRIKSFFNSKSERSIDNLTKIYENSELLYISVKNILLSELFPDNIKGKSILLKPNLVLQNRNQTDPICLFTHPNLIIATLKVLLECAPKSVVIGDAPVQNCDWNLMLSNTFLEEIEILSKQYCIPVKVVDFRKVIYNYETNEFGNSTRTEDDYLIFDVGKKSYLETITTDKNHFRVTNYDPDRMALSHSKGIHKYCVAKEVFEADIIITMPKSKTHRMSCITNSLKILVGINGDKDYLPHHRLGAKSHGGDCYKDSSVLRTLAEYVMDFANRRRGSVTYIPCRHFVSLLWKMSRPSKEMSMNAGWYGNDTVWRMVLDLNTITLYGKLDGTLADKPQRTIYTLCDSIIGGQGEGPLEPTPLALVFLAFSNDPYLMDVTMGGIFNLNIEKVPLLNEANDLIKDKNKKIIFNSSLVPLDTVIKVLKTNVVLSAGWENYNNK